MHLLGRISGGSEGTYDLGSTHGLRIRDAGPCARGRIPALVRLRPSSPGFLPPERQAGCPSGSLRLYLIVNG
ncbi:hypothetical protein HMPREF9056_02104 [Actinomyces sp. oral taxon 170 str. F0386]|nr:hypothetical protein HMPREF9056_02104 [Actinomyces sp. oral taxon 170 str. F0386]